MHEFTIMSSALKNIKVSLAEANIKLVSKIYLSVGTLSGVSIPALEYAYLSIDKDILFQNTELIINEPDIIIWCDKCNLETHILDEYVLQCPECHSYSNRIISGKELLIERVIVEYE